MVVYFVRWTKDDDLSRGSKRGRPKTSDYSYTATILCRNIHEALNAFAWCFSHYFDKDSCFSINDGKIEAHRMIIDSRNFNIQFLFMDKMKHPLYLPDIEGSLMLYSNILR